MSTDIARLLELQMKKLQEDRIYYTYKSIPSHIRAELNRAKTDDKLSGWYNTVKKLPQKTKAVPEAGIDLVTHSQDIWSSRVYGNDNVQKSLLRHAIEYAKTGRTQAVLLAGPPGTGKSLAAETYGEFLSLPTAFFSAPTAAAGCGWAGHSRVYMGATPGIPVQAMISAGCGNPVVCINELEKAGRGNQNGDFLESMLSALDDDAIHWYDNYIDFSIDISHVLFCFTANDLSRIPEPLLDRVDVLELKPLCKDDIHAITHKFTIPNAMKRFDCRTDEVVFPPETADYMIEYLWGKGVYSCRKYQQLVSQLISDAMIEHYMADSVVEIKEDNIRTLKISVKGKERIIGF